MAVYVASEPYTARHASGFDSSYMCQLWYWHAVSHEYSCTPGILGKRTTRVQEVLNSSSSEGAGDARLISLNNAQHEQLCIPLGHSI